MEDSIKDDSIELYGSIDNFTTKQTKDGQRTEIKFSVDTKQLKDRMDDLTDYQNSGAFFTITPPQTSLNTDEPDDQQPPRDVTPASGQIDFIDGGEA